MKRLQFKVQQIYSIDVDDNFDYSDESLQEVVKEHFDKNNMDASAEFFENIKIVCRDCGISLQNDEEKEDGCCAQCGAVKK